MSLAPETRVSPETWVRVAALFDRALDQPTRDRGALLDEACAGDKALRLEVEALLAADAKPANLLDGGVATGGAPLVEHVREQERSADEERWIGRRVGPYRPRSVLGRGGMATVFLAERDDGQFDERVALKLLRLGLATDEILSRFRQERQILARLRHPAITSLLHGGMTDDGLPYFAMEHVEGRTITEFSDDRRLDVRQRLGLILQVIDGVQHAHRNLVIHRDLKPSNILVTDAGTVRLLDFGIAKLLDPREDTAVTRVGSRVLTPQYAAPEQIAGEPATTAIDVYALGVLLYELLTGELPHRRSSKWISPMPYQEPVLPSLKVRASGAALAAALSRQLAGDLDAILLKALEAEPERRYATPEALAEDLRRHLGGEPVRVRPVTWFYRARKFVVRYRGASVVC